MTTLTLQEEFPNLYIFCLQIRLINPSWDPVLVIKYGIEYDKHRFNSIAYNKSDETIEMFIHYQKQSPERIENCFTLLKENLKIDETELIGTLPVSRKRKYIVETQSYKNIIEIQEILKSILNDIIPIEQQQTLSWQNNNLETVSDWISFLQCQRGFHHFY